MDFLSGDGWKIALGVAVALGTALAAFFKGLSDVAPLKARVSECEADRQHLHTKIGSLTNKIQLLEARLAIAEGSIATLTSLLKREIHLD